MKYAALVVALLVGAAVFSTAQSGPVRLPGSVVATDPPQEAPASFQFVTNGLVSQDQFAADADNFSEDATITGGEDAGLGPLYNQTSCKACHLNPVVGGGLDTYEVRIMVADGLGGFRIPKNGDTLLRQNAIDPAIQPRIPIGARKTLRRAVSLLGMGYPGAIRQADRLAVQAAQPPEMPGRIVMALGVVAFNPNPVFEAGFGTYGWKCQDVDILPFCAGAQFKEKGLTSIFHPQEDTDIDGNPVVAYDKVADPEDPPTADQPAGANIAAYTRFINSTQTPPPSYELDRTPDVQAGKQLFVTFQCAVCHTPTWITAPPGSKIPGHQPVSATHGNKIIHPLSDFMLHDIGTCDDEVPQGEAMANEIRTTPLWGLRTLPRLRHDGKWDNVDMAIRGHLKQAAGSAANYVNADALSQRQLRAYVESR